MTRLIRTVIVVVTAFLAIQLISLYLSWPKQIIVGSIAILFAIVAGRLSTSRVVTLALMLMSMTATFRYAWWRFNLVADYFTDESNNRIGIDSVFLLILLSAEAYTILIMVLGYFQTAWPLHRPPIQMPSDATTWPHVDVLIPTYNEPLSLVRYTALAAKNIDYPPEKLHVYILDDGTRADFRQFAIEAGVGYVTRVKHNHAKAGNINHALLTMRSPYVTIFDCDHVPTRSFLQITLGWMLVDPRLAMLQTPHHFYSPDPFERNLLQYKTIPSESELFYGIVQDGNDFWNATFFCGSCALIRRSALEEVGGIAVETVTEDAHTSLRMQKHGYNTAYINIPQAAGLATETLAAHVGQRIRWARGMIQILRTDNPLLGKGMNLAQRLCYFNAMIHFMYAVPRLVFLGAPLVYLLLGRTIIPGYWLAILAYAVPHLILSSVANSRIQGRYRHSFWNEIYETVLAPYILAPTLLALINPKLGEFNVTDKGSTLNETQFDGKIATPTKWLLLLNIVGIFAAPYRFFTQDSQHPGTVVMNLVWVMLNIVILGVAAAVAHEQRQRRASVRIEARIPMCIHLADGTRVNSMTIDMSVGGAAVSLPDNTHFAMGDKVKLSFPEHAGEEVIDGEIVGMGKGQVRFEFSVPTIAEQETITRALYSRADAWLIPFEAREADRPLLSLARVIRLSGYGIYQVCRSFFPDKPQPAKPRPAQIGAMILLACVLGGCARTLALDVPPAAPNSSSTPAANIASGLQVLTLKDMGLQNTIEMNGPHSYYSLHFTLSHALVSKGATLKLVFAFKHNLDPHTTALKISINGTKIATLVPPPPSASNQDSNTDFVKVDLPIQDAPLVRTNTVTFEFSGSGGLQREDLVRAQVLLRISSSSSLQVYGDRLQWQNDLSQLPLPVFDRDLQSTTTVPFVFVVPPNSRTMEAAGIVASWLGLLASSKPVRFSASVGDIPPGNVIVVSDDRLAIPSSLRIPAGTGAVLALRTNPSDPYGSVLILAANDGDQLLIAAQALSLTRKATATAPAEGLPMAGDTMLISDQSLPPPRKRNDAPRWMVPDRTTRLADCQTQDALQSDGSTPIPIYFHVPPDLYYGERQNLQLHLAYQYNALQTASGSALRVFLNGTLITEAALLPGTGIKDRQRLILVPVADMRPFGNTILFHFDFVPANREANQNPSSALLKGEILCRSSLDLHGLASWARMPNLELFANAGFPFTQLADLSQTVVILPQTPTNDELALYLQLMAHFGAQTGYPVLRVTVEGPDAVISQARDYLILGTVANQPAFQSIDALLPVALDSTGVHVKQARNYASLLSSIDTASTGLWSTLRGKARTMNLPSNTDGIPDALIEEIESPSSPDRSIVLIALQQNSSVNTFEDVFLERSQSRDISNSVALLRNSKFESYRLNGATYHVGDISWYAMMRIWLTQYFVLLLLVVTSLSFVVALWIRKWLSNRARQRLKLAEVWNTQN
jgi:cellulose synthase (UDP-forming)